VVQKCCVIVAVTLCECGSRSFSLKKGNSIFGACESKIRGVILFAKTGEVTDVKKLHNQELYT
jgi:hypothetical protein